MGDYAQCVIFYGFALMAIGCGLYVILAKNPVHSALALVLTFFATAGIWLLAQAEFLGLILILVYVGAVMTLFLFVIMMLDINTVSLRRRIARSIPVGILVAVLFGVLLASLVTPGQFGLPSLYPASVSGDKVVNVEQLGAVLYTHYAYAFLLAGALLLSAIVSAISLVHREPRQRKQQDPRSQIQVRRADRLRIVRMKTEQYE